MSSALSRFGLYDGVVRGSETTDDTKAMRQDPIEIVDADAGWPALFLREQERLSEALGPLLARPIEHIGSTSVPGLAAKPIIDMLAIISDVDDLAEVSPALTSLGWIHAPEPIDREGRRSSWCFPSIERRTHHLHIVEESSDDWRGWLAFRDLLRREPDTAKRYEALKRDCATTHGADPNQRDSYRAAKAPFIRELTARALAG